mmetsp:Transcript_67342/g.184682  ORF Transcript_67342/g.184682 Transcript_67342/m.184682 type:complete len:288 (+) Transcript_67342:2018-2881(+)
MLAKNNRHGDCRAQHNHRKRHKAGQDHFVDIFAKAAARKDDVDPVKFEPSESADAPIKVGFDLNVVHAWNQSGHLVKGDDDLRLDDHACLIDESAHSCRTRRNPSKERALLRVISFGLNPLCTTSNEGEEKEGKRRSGGWPQDSSHGPANHDAVAHFLWWAIDTLALSIVEEHVVRLANTAQWPCMMRLAPVDAVRANACRVSHVAHVLTRRRDVVSDAFDFVAFTAIYLGSLVRQPPPADLNSKGFKCRVGWAAHPVTALWALKTALLIHVIHRIPAFALAVTRVL